jgi:NitT/TauT family transport system substrate-binding protein
LYAKKLIGLLLCFSLVALIACTAPKEVAAPPEELSNTANEPAPAPTTVNILALKGPTGVGMVKMMDAGASDTSLTYNFSLGSSPDEAVAALTSGTVDIAAIPTNLAAKLYSKTNGDLKIIAINALGPLYILENGSSIASVDDLRGKTILASGEGATPQFVLEYLLRQTGLEPGIDVVVEYHAEHAEVATLLASNDGVIALLPEPFVSSVTGKNPNLKVAIDINQLWDEKASGQLALGCVVARSSFIAEHPEAVQSFLKDLETSINFSLQSPADAAQLCAKQGIIEDPAIAEKAIGRCGLVFISGSDMQGALTEFFEVLHQADNQSLGGAVPGSELYYTG